MIFNIFYITMNENELSKLCFNLCATLLYNMSLYSYHSFMVGKFIFPLKRCYSRRGCYGCRQYAEWILYTFNRDSCKRDKIRVSQQEKRQIRLNAKTLQEALEKNPKLRKKEQFYSTIIILHFETTNNIFARFMTFTI